MKHQKRLSRLFAFVLAMVLVASETMVAFAAEPVPEENEAQMILEETESADMSVGTDEEAEDIAGEEQQSMSEDETETEDPVSDSSEETQEVTSEETAVPDSSEETLEASEEDSIAEDAIAYAAEKTGMKLTKLTATGGDSINLNATDEKDLTRQFKITGLTEEDIIRVSSWKYEDDAEPFSRVEVERSEDKTEAVVTLVANPETAKHIWQEAVVIVERIREIDGEEVVEEVQETTPYFCVRFSTEIHNNKRDIAADGGDGFFSPFWNDEEGKYYYEDIEHEQAKVTYAYTDLSNEDFSEYLQFRTTNNFGAVKVEVEDRGLITCTKTKNKNLWTVKTRGTGMMGEAYIWITADGITQKLTIYLNGSGKFSGLYSGMDEYRFGVTTDEDGKLSYISHCGDYFPLHFEEFVYSMGWTEEHGDFRYMPTLEFSVDSEDGPIAISSTKYVGDDWEGKYNVNVNLIEDFEGNPVGTYYFNCRIVMDRDEHGNPVLYTAEEGEEDYYRVLDILTGEYVELPISVVDKNVCWSNQRKVIFESEDYDREYLKNQILVNKERYIAGYVLLERTEASVKLGTVPLGNDNGMVIDENGKLLGIWEWVNPNADIKASVYDMQSFAARFTPAKEPERAFISNLAVAVTQLKNLIVDVDDFYTENGDYAPFRLDYDVIGYYDTGDDYFRTLLNEAEVSVDYNLPDGVTVQEDEPDTEYEYYTKLPMFGGFINNKGSKLPEKNEITISVSRETEIPGAEPAETKKVTYSKKVTVRRLAYRLADLVVNVSEDSSESPVWGFDEDLGQVVVDYHRLSDKNEIPLQVKALKSTANEEYPEEFPEVVDDKIQLTWTTSDDSIADVKFGGKGGGYRISVKKKAGLVKLTCTAADSCKTSRVIYLNVKDNSPTIRFNKVVINKYNNIAANPVRLPFDDTVCSGGDRIEKVALDSKDPDAALYEFRMEEDGFYDMYVKYDSANKVVLDAWKAISKKVVADKKFIVTMKSGNVFEYKLNFAVDVTVPAASVKQTQKLNLAYKAIDGENTAGAAIIKLSGKNAVCNAEVITPGFAGKYNEEDGTIAVWPTDLTAARAALKAKKKTYFKVSVNIRMDGAADSPNNVTKVITLAAERKLPKFSLPALNLFAYETEANFNLLLNGKPYRNEYGEIDFTVKESDSEKVYIESEPDGSLFFQYNPMAVKSGTSYTIEGKCDLFEDTITLKGKMSIVGKKAQLTLGKSTVTLNKSTNIRDNGWVQIPVKMKDASNDLKIRTVYYTKNKKNKALFDKNGVTIQYDSFNQMILVGINADTPAIKDGTYTVPVYAQMVTFNDPEQPHSDQYQYYGVTKAANLKIVVTDKKITASFKGNGKLNLFERYNSEMQIKVTLKNTSSRIREMRLYGSAKDRFEGWYDYEANCFRLRATDNQDFTMKGSYKIGFVIDLEDGTHLIFDGKSKGQFFTVKPSNKAPKVTCIQSNNVLDRNVEYSSAAARFVLAPGINVERVEFANKADEKDLRVEWQYDEDNPIILLLDNTWYPNLLAPSAARKVKLNVYLWNAPKDAKPITVTYTIAIR